MLCLPIEDLLPFIQRIHLNQIERIGALDNHKRMGCHFSNQSLENNISDCTTLDNKVGNMASGSIVVDTNLVSCIKGFSGNRSCRSKSSSCCNHWPAKCCKD